jgi:hypothetical protein
MTNISITISTPAKYPRQDGAGMAILGQCMDIIDLIRCQGASWRRDAPNCA